MDSATLARFDAIAWDVVIMATVTKVGRMDEDAAAEVRDQVERMIGSEVFQGSPQLSAFLRYVVEAAVEGRGDRLKGYVIGVEVLKRTKDFDPLIDPIVRVEATRLRRAIERYYAGPGVNDRVVIKLPPGGYVPLFHWREETPAASPVSNTPGLAAAAPPPPAAEPSALLRPGNGMPSLRVAPFVVVGTPQLRALAAEALSGRICDAIARFGSVNVATGALPASRASSGAASDSAGMRSDFRLDGTVEYRSDGTADVRLRLVDESDTMVVWSRTFPKIRCTESADDPDASAIVVEVANTLVAPFGVIRAHDRAKHLGDHAGDPRYLAVLEASDSLWTFDPIAHARARLALEQLTAANPGFAEGFVYLAMLYCREYQFDIGVRERESPALLRALKAIRRGIRLKPESARGYHALFGVLFFLDDIEGAFAAAERAIALNKYDMTILAEYGGRLICCGGIDKGLEILSTTSQQGAVRPSWHHFYLFLGYYLKGDIESARRHADQLTLDDYVFTHVAHALVATSRHDMTGARQAVQQIVDLAPKWRDDLRSELAKFLHDPAVLNRIVDDLSAAGLKPAA
jgi:tetratricopeptide (TPR) repeat protein/TolB-like protein